MNKLRKTTLRKATICLFSLMLIFGCLMTASADTDVPKSAMPEITSVKLSDVCARRMKVSWTCKAGANGFYIYSLKLKYNSKTDDFYYTRTLLKTVKRGTTRSTVIRDLTPANYYEIQVIPYQNVNSRIRRGTKEPIWAENYNDACTEYCRVGSFYSTNVKAQKSLNSIFRTYKENQKYRGSGECYGWAEWASRKIARTRTKVNVNKSFTVANVNKYIVGCKPGTHVRISGHSLVILKATSKRIYWVDNNYNFTGNRTGANRVHYWAGTPAEFRSCYRSHNKIEWLYKPTSFR